MKKNLEIFSPYTYYIQMKYYIVILMLFILFVPLKTDLSAGSIDTTNLIAYPNPFKPNTHGVVKIGFNSGAGATTFNIAVTILNINGDLVSTISGSIDDSTGTYIYWNGRNSRGTMVYPGLYILRIKIEDSTAIPSETGNSAVKIIRLLVNH